MNQLSPLIGASQNGTNSEQPRQETNSQASSFKLYPMQQPTCTNLRIRSITDALRIFTAVKQGILYMISSRLSAEDRQALRSGCIYVWEERSSAEIGSGIERFTDGRKWSPSCERKVRFQPTFACHLSAQSSYSSFCFTMRSIHCHQILTTMGIVFVFHPSMLNF